MIVEKNLNLVEINKIEFAQKVIDIFKCHKDIEHLVFNVDDSIVSIKENNTNILHIKEKTSLNQIGFLPINLDLLHIYPDLELKKINKCLFHLIFVGKNMLIKSLLDSYPLTQFSDQLLKTNSLENFSKNYTDCPFLRKYLSENNINYLIEDFFLNNIILKLQTIEKEQFNSYPLIKINDNNRLSYNIKRFYFYRNNIEDNINTFYGQSLVSKLRSISLFNQLEQISNKTYICRKKI